MSVVSYCTEKLATAALATDLSHRVIPPLFPGRFITVVAVPQRLMGITWTQATPPTQAGARFTVLDQNKEFFLKFHLLVCIPQCLILLLAGLIHLGYIYNTDQDALANWALIEIPIFALILTRGLLIIAKLR